MDEYEKLKRALGFAAGDPLHELVPDPMRELQTELDRMRNLELDQIRQVTGLNAIDQLKDWIHDPAVELLMNQDQMSGSIQEATAAIWYRENFNSQIAAHLQWIASGYPTGQSGILNLTERLKREQIEIWERFVLGDMGSVCEAMMGLDPPAQILSTLDMWRTGPNEELAHGELLLSEDDGIDAWKAYQSSDEVEGTEERAVGDEVRKRIQICHVLPRIDGNLRDQVRSMSWKQFEEYVAELFDANGFDVEMTPHSGDGGRDIVATREVAGVPIIMAVECKAWKRKVGVGVLRSLIGTVQTEKATVGVLATTSTFTQVARSLLVAEKHQINGMDLDSLVRWHRDLKQKRRR